MQLRYARDSDGRPATSEPTAAGVHCWHTPRGTVIAYGFERDGWHWMCWPSLATFRFSATEPCITAFAEPGVSVDLTEDIYRRGVLPMALQALGHEALHASAVLAADGVVAFAARSRTGKSTVAFGLSRRGYRQWADDGVALRLTGGNAFAVPLPFGVRLRHTSSSMFGPDTIRPPQSRHENRSELPHLKPTPICALCILDQSPADASGERVTIRQLEPADAFASVLVHAHEFNPFNEGRRKRMLQAYLDLVAIVPVYAVRFQPGPDCFSHLLDVIIAIVGLGQPDERRVLVG